MKNDIDLDKLEVISQRLLEKIEKISTDEASTLVEFTNFRLVLNQESDRGCVLMAAAFIEDKIGHLIESYLADDKKIRERFLKNNGPLATFSSKLDLAFLLGLIPKNIFNDLHLLRKIRNEFAHSASLMTFESPSIKDRVYALSVLSKALLRNAPKAYFLRSMTTILTFINMKMNTFQKCTIDIDFDISIFDDSLKKVEDAIQKNK